MVLNGTFQRNAGLEAPEHLGRGERHGGLFKKVAKTLIKEFNVTGKRQMKSMMYVAVETKNDSMRKGGIAPSQWVIGKYPRRPGELCEEEEWGQLGVMQAQNESATEFGIRARQRLEARKTMVQIDCGRRFKQSQIKRAEPLKGNYSIGDLVMYRKDQDTDVPGDEWCGPARIVGFDDKTVNVIHGTVPVMTALHKLRPASAAEMMAYQVLSRNMRPIAPQIAVAPGQQLGMVDARVAAPAPPARVAAPATPIPAPATPASAAQPTPGTPSSSRRRAPRLIQAVTDPVAPVVRENPEEMIVAYDDRTQLE